MALWRLATERLSCVCSSVACLSHYHLTFTTESIHNLLKSCLTFGNKTSPLFSLWSNHTKQDKTKIERLLYIVRETWGECKNPSGSGRGEGVLWSVGGWLSEIVRGTKGLFFVCCLVLWFQNCTFSAFTFSNPLLLLSANRSSGAGCSKPG